MIAQPGITTAPGRGSSSSTISSTVTIDRAEASTTSFWTPVIPQSWTLPVPVGLLRVDDPDVRPDRGHRRELLARERALDPRHARPRRQIGAAVAAQHPEGQVRRACRVCRRHPGVRVLLELERRRPAVLDRVAEAVQRADARVAAPREDELPRAAGADQLVVDRCRASSGQRQRRGAPGARSRARRRTGSGA